MGPNKAVIYMFCGCPNCKFIWFIWPDNDEAYTNHLIRQKETNGIVCPMCFAEMKIVSGFPAEKLCHHGRPVNVRCFECRQAVKKKEKIIKELKDKIKEIENVKP